MPSDVHWDVILRAEPTGQEQDWVTGLLSVQPGREGERERESEKTTFIVYSLLIVRTRFTHTVHMSASKQENMILRWWACW